MVLQVPTSYPCHSHCIFMNKMKRETQGERLKMNKKQNVCCNEIKTVYTGVNPAFSFLN